MALRNNSLFRAVVVLGAALPACRKSDRAPEPVPKPPVSAPAAVEDHRPAPAASVATEVTSSVVPSTPAAPSASPTASAPPSAIDSTQPRPHKPVAGRPCPPGSELPFPPCYYIL